MNLVLLLSFLIVDSCHVAPILITFDYCHYHSQNLPCQANHHMYSFFDFDSAIIVMAAIEDVVRDQMQMVESLHSQSLASFLKPFIILLVVAEIIVIVICQMVHESNLKYALVLSSQEVVIFSLMAFSLQMQVNDLELYF